MKAEANYIISISETNLRLAQVEASLSLAGDMIIMADWGHPGFPGGWAKFVHNLEITAAFLKMVDES